MAQKFAKLSPNEAHTAVVVAARFTMFFARGTVFYDAAPTSGPGELILRVEIPNSLIQTGPNAGECTLVGEHNNGVPIADSFRLAVQPVALA